MKNIAFISLALAAIVARAQGKDTAYFIDGYHGGIYGHIPTWQTRFMADQLKTHPGWKINLELEPESWDTIAAKYPDDLKDFTALYAEPGSRIEYVNPAYGQSYLYNVSGESVVRQFYYGMRKLKEHFPFATFTTYSSEEPCFTSALPEILTSFGFKYASLKNPNTCWGGYAAAYGGELVNWIGPDGTRITTVPRYAVESLKPKSTWETIASNNAVNYVNAALQAGITAPVGMCLQDAGWKNGPWHTAYQPTVYDTWTHYIEHHTTGKTTDNWHFSQEDVLTSLVWGGQILQRVAQKVRASETRIVATEKLASMTGLDWPEASLDEAWRTLLLSEHHDCWIVPYNKRAGLTWADYVDEWTGNTDTRAEAIATAAMDRVAPASPHPTSVTVFNTTAIDRTENVTVGDHVIRVTVPAMGWTTLPLPKTARERGTAPETGAKAFIAPDNTCHVVTDKYTVVLDPAKGGAIRTLTAAGKSYVDARSPRHFGELRGNFYNQGGFHSTADNPAKITIETQDPLEIKVKVQGEIAGAPFTQTYTFEQGDPRIDIHLHIDWKDNTGIGEDPSDVKGDPLKKAFYNDSFKLQALFPLALEGQQVYKDAPFDVTHSRLTNTFFDRWDSIKNVVVNHWVDVTDKEGRYGLAVYSDQTTSYAHGPHYPLGLTLQYSGDGLFYRNYTLTGPLDMHYALLPHEGTWDKAQLWTEATKMEEPLLTRLTDKAPETHSLLRLAVKGWEATSVTDSNGIRVRLFNAEGATTQKVYPGFAVSKAQSIALDGRVLESLKIQTDEKGEKYVAITAPRFGIRTLAFETERIAPFHTGDRVAFVGNSITEQGYYESYVWLYYMLHFPKERITVFNTGIGGDRAEEIYKRWDDDVLPKKPTVVCLTFGMNDSGYFEYLGHDTDSVGRAKVADSKMWFEKIEDKLKAMPNVRKVIETSSPYDATMKNPKNYFPGKTKAMEAICDIQQQAAADNHWGYVDYFHPMTAINMQEQKRDSEFTLTGSDRIHPGQAGHFVMAYLFLKAQGLGDKPVAEMAIDARTAAKSVTNCAVTNVAPRNGGVTFDYLANALPFPVDTIARLWGNPRPMVGAVPLLPFYTGFNREMLKVSGLDASKSYVLTMNGRTIGHWTGADFAEGINLAKQTNTPEYDQAVSVLALNEERMLIEAKVRAYYWLQFDYFRGIHMKFQDDRAAMDSVETASVKRWDVASKRDNYRTARFPAVRASWQRQMTDIVNEIYTIDQPRTIKVGIAEE
ncbi:MAG TPA: GDSL-type esterase/lipase family protein [Dinghuibacter sp.]|uniref:GDSL-type esterase/lipase family protein n=1 Tax=Dinghuibacter sp. TaxID=2024697 RepID=UPI002C6D7089|nr:GDSL-type esterase/lipase family protein [Dinghuibacter sp.]HTJ12553.1 GDSL-type esterase/lipase family protein [Dinghuibacter sp.]